MAWHICSEVDYCLCDTMALEPNEDCPIHGPGPFPPRCAICGRFMPWPVPQVIFDGPRLPDVPEVVQ